MVGTQRVHAVQLTADTDTATAGYYQLSWQADNAVRYQLQEARDAGFSTVHVRYEGPDRATVITGRANGDYYYRVRALTPQQQYGTWSAPVRVTVEHHQLGQAFGFFGVGSLVFIAILIAILRGNHQTQHKDPL